MRRTRAARARRSCLWLYEYFPCEHKSHSAEPFTVLVRPRNTRLAFRPIRPRVPLVACTVGQQLAPVHPSTCAPDTRCTLTRRSPPWLYEYLPREHSVQAVDPFTSLYVPAMHAAQVAPSGPVYPLLHVQLVSTLLPAPEYVCAGHALHVDSEMLPVAVEYFPCEHRVHAAEPFTSLYVPATHASHSTPSAPVYPLLHVQLVSTLLPAPEYVCAGHALHVDSELLPVAVEYFPCEHKCARR